MQPCKYRQIDTEKTVHNIGLISINDREESRKFLSYYFSFSCKLMNVLKILCIKNKLMIDYDNATFEKLQLRNF